MPGRRQNGHISQGYPSDYASYPTNGYVGGDSRAAADMSTGEHVYSVDHLVTWTVGAEHGVLTHQDGMRQLSKMEQQTGIFTMRCVLTVENNCVQIVDGQTAEIMEKFPLDCVRDPVAVKDKNGMFNNIALFTVVEEPRNKHSQSEMHIFQVIGRGARELADDIAEAALILNSKPNRSSKGVRQTPPSARRASSYGNLEPISVKDAINKFELTYNSSSQEHDDGVSRAPRPRELRASRRVVENESDSEDDVKMGVSLLNRCFDDIERFILRLKQSARALQELTSRKRRSKGRKHGDGMLTMRSRAPAPAEFAECFQKVKLSFNLLARLRNYLHNPNSTELVHFLFTPLSLLVEASNDPRFDIHDLVRKVVTPLLSKQAVELLDNCLTSKEYEFWMSLGEAWRIPRGKWTYGQVHEFKPKFSDGYQPSEAWLEKFLGNTLANLAAKHAMDRLSREVEEEPAQHFNGMSNGRNGHDLGDGRQGRRSSGALRSPSQEFPSPPSDVPLYTSRSDRNAEPGPSNRSTPWDDYQKSYLRDLQQRNAKIYEVVQDRKGNNSKELTIRRGEIVEVLNDERNWWKCANINGDQGFVPYTLLKRYENVEGLLQSPTSDQFVSPRSSSNTAASASPVSPPQQYVPVPPPPPPTLPPPGFINGEQTNGNWRLSKKSSSGKGDYHRYY